VRGVTFYSFQFDTAAGELGEPGGTGIVDLAPELGNWSHTAGALTQMDLVIAVDSSLAHLAGAMGLPVWIALMAAVEWRWASRAQPAVVTTKAHPANAGAARPRVLASFATPHAIPA